MITALLAYVGVYAGVILGSMTAEELPVGRYRLRLVQMIIIILASLIGFGIALGEQSVAVLAITVLLLAIEFSFLFEHVSKVLKHIHPGRRQLISYAVLGLLVAFVPGQYTFVVAALVFLYGLVTGSLIAEPFVEDRRLVPARQPYKVALDLSWTYPVVLILVFLVQVLN